MRDDERWRPTPAHARAVFASLALGGTAVIARRPDLVVMAVPLFVAAAWASRRRPVAAPHIDHQLGHTTVREGSATTLSAAITCDADGVDHVAAVFTTPTSIEQAPVHGQVAAECTDGTTHLAVVVSARRWGHVRFSPPLVVASSAWNGFRFVSRREATRLELTALPRGAPFDTTSQEVRSPGLVGTNRSSRYGAGAELATVRPFQPGDRLRRIHWVQTLRTDEIHVTTTWADQDRQVVLLIDAFEDLGASDEVGARESSLDVSVRAAAAIAEHYIRSGDRVGMVAMGAHGLRRVQPSSGNAHLRRLLEALARIEPANVIHDDGRMPRGLKDDALVLVMSPFTSEGARQRLVRISDRCADVIAIDCLPLDIADGFGDPLVSIAWRIERLARERHLRAIRNVGLPVVPWTGSGSLDQVLRAQQRRSSVRVGRRR